MSAETHNTYNSVVEAEFNLFHARVEELGEQLQGTPDPEVRARLVATVAIEFFDMVDSVDHQTSLVFGGTPEIQDLATLGRQTVRKFTAEHIAQD